MLPEGWVQATLGEFAEFVMGQAPPGDDCNVCGEGTPFVKAGEFGLDRPVIREWTTKPLKMAAREDVLICVVGATAGKLNLGADCAIGRSVAAIRPTEASSATFIYPRLKSEVARLRGASTGTAQGVISREMLAAIDVALPPLAEQHRIVAKLDALTARLARARAELERVPTSARELRQRALDAAFDLLSVSDRTLIDIIDETRGITYGIVQTGDHVLGGVPTVRGGDIKQHGIKQDILKLVDPSIAADYRRTVLRGGEVVISIRGTIGNAAEVPLVLKGCNISREVALIPVRAEWHPRFIVFLLSSSKCQRFLTDHTKGSAQPGINLSDLRRLPVPAVDADLQSKVVNQIEATFARADRLEAEAARARALLDRLEAAILAKAFRGELVPQDPTDEPASVLLDRIRAVAPKPKRGRRAQAPRVEP